MLAQIQNELKAPKSNVNKFGGYNYRSCEDILEALKPILLKHKATLTISDDIVLVGNRYYIKATVTLILSDERVFTTSSFAREEETKKGMDASQITGSASSYARKYALNAMFAIDDTKDADATNTHEKDEPKPQPKPETKPQPKVEVNYKSWLMNELKKQNIDVNSFVAFMGWTGKEPSETSKQCEKFYKSQALWEQQVLSYVKWENNNLQQAQGGE